MFRKILPAASLNKPETPVGAMAPSWIFGLAWQTRKRGLLVSLPNFGIECGSDAVLFVFARQQESWKEVLRWQSEPYNTVAGAFWSFEYGISPPDESGAWYVVTKRIKPWCSSTWAGIDHSVLRPVSGTTRPKVLSSGSDEIWWGDEDFGKLEVNRDDFDLRFHAGSIDDGIHNRVWIRRFSVVGDSVRRIPPVAASPRDFVDEWIVSPWGDASQWSTSSAIGLLQMHRRLNKDRSFEYDSVRRCSDGPDHYQVEIDDSKRTYYFQVLGETDYKMKAVSEKPNAVCKGEDILETMGTK